jgi:hypothetical protein
MSVLKILWRDIRQGENLDLYVTLLVAIVFILLSLLGVASLSLIFSSTLAVLVLIAINLLANRHKTEELFKQLAKTSEGMFREEFPSTLKHDIEQAQELWLVGVSLNTTIRSYYSLLEKKLRQGHSIRVLLVAPQGSGAAMAEMRVYGKPNIERNRTEIIGILDYLCDLKNVADNALEVRTLDYPLGIGGFAINPDRASGALYLENYPFKTPGGSLPKFVLRAQDGRWYDFYKTELLLLWGNATIWECKTQADE